MPYTRRDLIRDAALISATGAVAGSPFALGVRKKSQFVGVRVFFCGSWIFCSNGADGLYAIAKDIFEADGSSTHFFPFGKWQKTTVPFDKSMPQLAANPAKCGGAKNVAPFMISIPDWSNTLSVSTIFQQAQQDVPFAYFNNKPDATSNKCPIKLDFTACGLRVISLPIPTRICGAGYLTTATINDNSQSILNNPSSHNQSVSGVATTHIFEYEGADCLTFKTADVVDTMRAVDPISHYHFHTVPRKNMGGHGPAMFHNLLGLLSDDKPFAQNGSSYQDDRLYLNSPCPPIFQAGPSNPDGGDAELDYDPKATPCPDDRANGATANSTPMNLFLGDLASCSGPGFGIEGDVGN